MKTILAITIFFVISIATTGSAYGQSQPDSLISQYNQLFKDYSAIDLDKAKEFLDSALALCESTGSKPGLAQTCLNLGAYWEQKGAFKIATDYSKKALKWFEKTNDVKGISLAYNNLGNVYFKQGEFEKANQHYQLALRQKEKFTSKYSLKQSIFNLGTLFLSKNEYQKAEAYFQQCLAIEKTLGDSLGMGNTLKNLGIVYFNGNEYAKATTYFDSAIAISQKTTGFETVAGALMYLGDIQYAKDNLEDATKLYDSSLFIANQYRLDDYLGEISLKLSDLSYEQKEFKKAYDYYMVYAYAHKKITDIKDEIEKLETQFEKEKQTLIHQNQQKTRTIIFVAIIAVLVCAMIVAYLYLKINIQTKERDRFAKDLHDGLGAIISTIKMFLGSLIDKASFKDKNTELLVSESIKLIDDIRLETKNIAFNLSPEKLKDKEISKALEDMFNLINLTKKIKFTHHNLGLLDNKFGNRTKINLYRVLQEIINNIMKYAKAKNIEINIQIEQKNLIIAIQDDGSGVDYTQSNGMGMGLHNIQRRLRKIRGKVYVNAMQGQGTETLVKIKYKLLQKWILKYF